MGQANWTRLKHNVHEDRLSWVGYAGALRFTRSFDLWEVGRLRRSLPDETKVKTLHYSSGSHSRSFQNLHHYMTYYYLKTTSCLLTISLRKCQYGLSCQDTKATMIDIRQDSILPSSSYHILSSAPRTDPYWSSDMYEHRQEMFRWELLVWIVLSHLLWFCLD